MRNAKAILAIALVAIASAGLAQVGEGEKRGSIPLGTSQDGSGPSDGALKGGSLKPAGTASKDPLRDASRCKELVGSLREDCLQDMGASAGTLGAAQSDAAPAVPPSQTLYADPRRRRR